MFRNASLSDLPFVQSMAAGVTSEILEAHGSSGRFRIIEVNGRAVGFFKSYMLWERVPFIEIIMISESERRCGVGTRAVRHWENEMRPRGFNVAALSTQEQDAAQHFWHMLGYEVCGRLSILGRPVELFMQRSLGASCP